MWGYEGTRYWLPGNADFYALYPSVETLGDAVSSATCTDGTFTVKGFDATKGHDLMTAKRRVSPSWQARQNLPVR